MRIKIKRTPRVSFSSSRHTGKAGEEFLQALFKQVQVIAYEQIQLPQCTSLQTSVQHFFSEGWLSSATLLSRPVPDIVQPLGIGASGQPVDSEAIAYAAQRRGKSPLQRTRVLCLTDAVPAVLANEHCLEHHLGVSAILLHFHKSHPPLARAFRGEATVREFMPVFAKLPDALLVDDLGRPKVAVEYVGYGYGACRVQAAWEAAQRRGLEILFF